MMNEKRLEEIIQKYECVLKLREASPDYSNGYKSVTKVMQEFLQDLSTLKEEKEMLLGEDKPHGGDLGCRIYGYLKGDVKVTRVEYYKEEKDNVVEMKTTLTDRINQAQNNAELWTAIWELHDEIIRQNIG